MQGTLNTTLIVRFSSVGDLLLTTPVIRALRRRFPAGRIDFLVRSDCAELLRGNPHCNSILEFPAGGTSNDLSLLRDRIRRTGYDLIVDLHGSLRSRILLRGLRNVVRIRKRVVPRWFLVRFKLDYYSFFGGSPGVTARYFEPLRPWGIMDDGEGPEIFPSQEAQEAARACAVAAGVSERSEWIGIAPSAKHATKMWPWERFAKAAAELAGARRCGVILFGGSADTDLCGRTAEQIRSLRPGVAVLDASGKLTLQATAALMDRCTVILTNDSGLMHLAASRKRKLVALFGSTVGQFGFYPPAASSIVVEQHGLRCRPCTHIGRDSCPLGHFRCMTEIGPERVVAAASAIISS